MEIKQQGNLQIELLTMQKGSQTHKSTSDAFILKYNYNV